MAQFLLSVLVISLSGVMMPGPMFTVTLAKSYKSRFAGTQVALGHTIVEVPLILLIYFGFARFFQHHLVQFIVSLIGGGMLAWLGVSMFRARAKVVKEGRDLPYNSVMAGVITSALNPFFLLWWATVGSMLVMNSLSFGLAGFALLILVHLMADLVWLSFVSLLVNKTRSLWGKGFQQGLFIVCSLALIGLGGWFLSSGVRLAL